MYIPALNAEHDPEVLFGFMETHPFAVLVTASANGVLATHLPLVLDRTRGAHGTLEGHLARANPQSRDRALVAEALVIFSGPNAYITPSWYPSTAQHGKVVPTWNYVAIHAYGDLQFRDDGDFLQSHLERLTNQQEAPREKPWAVGSAPREFIEQQKLAIIGFEFVISRLEGKWKMSQNRSSQDVDGVVAGLASSSAPEDRAVSALVNAAKPRDRE